MTTLMTVGTDLPQVRKNAVSFWFSPRISHEKRCFTKTGSGQTDENHSKRAFCLTQHTVIATALSATTLINTSVRIRLETACLSPSVSGCLSRACLGKAIDFTSHTQQARCFSQATVMHYRMGHVHVRAALLLSAASAATAVGASYLALQIDEAKLRQFLAVAVNNHCSYSVQL